MKGRHGISEQWRRSLLRDALRAGDVVEYARSKCDSLGLGHLEFVQGNAYDLDPTKSAGGEGPWRGGSQ